MARWARSETAHTRRRTRIQELLDLIFGSEPWMAEGACVSAGAGDPWYPTLKGDQYTEKSRDAALAKRICRTRCPVRDTCLDFALRTEEPHGIWGGLDRRQRQRMLVRPLQLKQSAAGRVLRSDRDEEPIMPDPDGQPTCVCTKAELESGKFFPDCPRHRPPDPPWTGPDDWS